MVISFSVPQARKQLLDHGEVYTFRWTRRAYFAKGKGVVERTWANKKRGLSRIADVEIEEVGEFPCGPSLRPYAEKSGFENVCGWRRKILEMANPHGYIDGWLYRITLQSPTENPTPAPTAKKEMKNTRNFPLDESGNPRYPLCLACPRHPEIADCEDIDICEFEYCEEVVERYPEDFQSSTPTIQSSEVKQR